jgi:hypothetical protein
MSSFHRQQQRFASQYQQHVYSVDRDKILCKLAALTPFFYFTAAQFSSMGNLLVLVLMLTYIYTYITSMKGQHPSIQPTN